MPLCDDSSIRKDIFYLDQQILPPERYYSEWEEGRVFRFYSRRANVNMGGKILKKMYFRRGKHYVYE